MRGVLGFDGGGTKTDCVLMDEACRILARSSAGPSNPSRIGVKAALAAIQEAARGALAGANAQQTIVVALVAGLAGTGNAKMSERMDRALRAAFPRTRLQVITDLELVLAAAGEGPAIVLVAGTGSAAIGRNEKNHTLRGGGLGPAAGDEGSAYDIGRIAIAAFLKTRESEREESQLARRILRASGAGSWEELEALAKSRAEDLYPRIFPIVALEAGAGAAAAQSLLRQAAGKLARLVREVADGLELAGKPFFLAKTGGMIGRCAWFDEQLDRLLQQTAPRAKIGALPVPPVEMAARRALQLMGETQRTSGSC